MKDSHLEKLQSDMDNAELNMSEAVRAIQPALQKLSLARIALTTYLAVQLQVRDKE